MTQEVLIDLCERLPYGVKVSAIGWDKPIYLMQLDINRLFSSSLDTPKPYLRPMSSMTEEEREEYTSYCFEQPFLQKDKTPNLGSIPMCIDWLNAHHFDFRGLIEKGLALEAPTNMYKIK